jgi:uncharacterized protein (DUF1330 family)
MTTQNPNAASGMENQKEDSMKKGYWVVAYRSISDESAVKAYGALAVPAVQSFGGRFLTRSTSRVQTHEVGLQQRAVIVEFDSYVDRACGSRKRGLPKGPSSTWVGSPIPITGHAGHRQQ